MGCGDLFRLSEKQVIYKNFIAFNAAFILIFAAFDDVAMIASVLNQSESLGNGSQAILYITQFITALVFPQVFIESIGFKFTLLLAEVFYLLFFAANFYPSWYTLGPASVLVGFANSLAWTALGIYFTLLSKRLSIINNISFLNAQTRLFGWFGSIFLLNYVLGAIWIGSILQLKDVPLNSTYNYAENCGANNCPKTMLPKAASEPTLHSIYTLCATLNGACMLAILITLLFVDDLKYDENLNRIKRGKVTLESVRCRFKDELSSLMTLAKDINVWLLLPVAVFFGYELTMIWFEFYRAFASCLKNINYIGWTSIVFGGAAGVFSVLGGYIIKYIGLQTTMVMMLMAAISHGIFIIAWTPSADESYVIFIMIVAFAYTDCLATAQVRAVFGIFFPNNSSAYSAAIIFETVGLVIGSVFSIFFCTRTKAYFYIFIASLSIVAYVILEIKTGKEQRKDQIEGIKNRDVSFEHEHKANEICLSQTSSF